MAELITHSENEGGETVELAWIEMRWQRPVQRIFWIYNVSHYSSRGGHHHRSCRMVLQCITGSVDVYVQTPKVDQHFTLNSTNQYLFLDAQDWRLMYQFSTDARLVIFADKSFETTIYIDSPYRSSNLNSAITLPVKGKRNQMLRKS